MIEQEATRAAVAITVDVTGNVPAAQTLLGKIDQEMTRRNAKRSDVTSGGVKLAVYAIAPNARRTSPARRRFFIHQDMLCATDSRAEAEEMIARFSSAW